MIAHCPQEGGGGDSERECRSAPGPFKQWKQIDVFEMPSRVPFFTPERFDNGVTTCDWRCKAFTDSHRAPVDIKQFIEEEKSGMCFHIFRWKHRRRLILQHIISPWMSAHVLLMKVKEKSPGLSRFHPPLGYAYSAFSGACTCALVCCCCFYLYSSSVERNEEMIVHLVLQTWGRSYSKRGRGIFYFNGVHYLFHWPLCRFDCRPCRAHDCAQSALTQLPPETNGH